MKGKNIIILGEPRCGKTTLTNCIVNKYGYEAIRGDIIRDSLYSIDENDNMLERYKNIRKKSKEYIYTYYESLSTDLKYIDRGIVLDDTEITLKDCTLHFNKYDNLIYCLGITLLSNEQLFENIIQYSKDNEWSSKIPIYRLYTMCNMIIDKSRKLKEECEKYPHVRFYDTGIDRELVLGKIMEDIDENILIVN